MSNKYFRDVIKEGVFTVKEVLTDIKKEFPSIDLRKIEPIVVALVKLKVKITAITYQTVDPNHNPIEASGIIMRPLTRKSRGVLHFMPSANIDKYGSGGDVLLIFEGFLAFFGYTVIIPDLLGNGVSKDAVPYPFLMAENTGEVAYHMHLAAMEYFNTVIGRPLPKHISVGGYSMGGVGALALVRKMEQENHPGIHIDRAIIGGGIYDITTALHHYIKNDFSEYPASPFVIAAYDHWYHLHLDYTKVFNEPLLSHHEQWLSRNYDRFQLLEWIGQKVSNYLHPSFFDPQNPGEFKGIWESAQKNSLATGWTPKTRLRMSHAVDDRTVPVEVAQYTYQQFKQRGANVRMHYGKGGHYTFGMWYFLRMAFYLILKRFAFWTR